MQKRAPVRVDVPFFNIEQAVMFLRTTLDRKPVYLISYSKLNIVQIKIRCSLFGANGGGLQMLRARNRVNCFSRTWNRESEAFEFTCKEQENTALIPGLFKPELIDRKTLSKNSSSRHTGKLLRCRSIILFITRRFIHCKNGPSASHFIPPDDCDPNPNA